MDVPVAYTYLARFEVDPQVIARKCLWPSSSRSINAYKRSPNRHLSNVEPQTLSNSLGQLRNWHRRVLFPDLSDAMEDLPGHSVAFPGIEIKVNQTCQAALLKSVTRQVKEIAGGETKFSDRFADRLFLQGNPTKHFVHHLSPIVAVEEIAEEKIVGNALRVWVERSLLVQPFKFVFTGSAHTIFGNPIPFLLMRLEAAGPSLLTFSRKCH
jgi:hypothetical protein